MRLVAPHQPRQADCIDVAIYPLLAQPAEHHSAVRRTTRSYNAPPGGQEFQRRRQMALRCD